MRRPLFWAMLWAAGLALAAQSVAAVPLPCFSSDTRLQIAADFELDDCNAPDVVLNFTFTSPGATLRVRRSTLRGIVFDYSTFDQNRFLTEDLDLTLPMLFRGTFVNSEIHLLRGSIVNRSQELIFVNAVAFAASTITNVSFIAEELTTDVAYTINADVVDRQICSNYAVMGSDVRNLTMMLLNSNDTMGQASGYASVLDAKFNLVDGLQMVVSGSYIEMDSYYESVGIRISNWNLTDPQYFLPLVNDTLGNYTYHVTIDVQNTTFNIRANDYARAVLVDSTAPCCNYSQWMRYPDLVLNFVNNTASVISHVPQDLDGDAGVVGIRRGSRMDRCRVTVEGNTGFVNGSNFGAFVSVERNGDLRDGTIAINANNMTIFAYSRTGNAYVKGAGWMLINGRTRYSAISFVNNTIVVDSLRGAAAISMWSSGYLRYGSFLLSNNTVEATSRGPDAIAALLACSTRFLSVDALVEGGKTTLMTDRDAVFVTFPAINRTSSMQSNNDLRIQNVSDLQLQSTQAFPGACGFFSVEGYMSSGSAVTVEGNDFSCNQGGDFASSFFISHLQSGGGGGEGPMEYLSWNNLDYYVRRNAVNIGGNGDGFVRVFVAEGPVLNGSYVSIHDNIFNVQGNAETNVTVFNVTDAYARIHTMIFANNTVTVTGGVRSLESFFFTALYGERSRLEISNVTITAQVSGQFDGIQFASSGNPDDLAIDGLVSGVSFDIEGPSAAPMHSWTLLKGVSGEWGRSEMALNVENTNVTLTAHSVSTPAAILQPSLNGTTVFRDVHVQQTLTSPNGTVGLFDILGTSQVENITGTVLISESNFTGLERGMSATLPLRFENLPNITSNCSFVDTERLGELYFLGYFLHGQFIYQACQKTTTPTISVSGETLTTSPSPSGTISSSLSGNTPSSTLPPTPSVEPTDTDTLSRSSTLPATPSTSISGSLSLAATLSPSVVPTRTPTMTESAPPTFTKPLTRSDTSSMTHTPAATASFTASVSRSGVSPSLTVSGSRSTSRSATITPPPAPSQTLEATRTPSTSLSLTIPPTATPTVSHTPSETVSMTPPPTLTATPSRTVPPTATVSVPITESVTATITPPPTPTPSASPTTTVQPTQSVSLTVTVPLTATVSSPATASVSQSQSVSGSISESTSVSLPITASQTIVPTPTVSFEATTSLSITTTRTVSVSAPLTASATQTSSDTLTTTLDYTLPPCADAKLVWKVLNVSAPFVLSESDDNSNIEIRLMTLREQAFKFSFTLTEGRLFDHHAVHSLLMACDNGDRACVGMLSEALAAVPPNVTLREQHILDIEVGPWPQLIMEWDSSLTFWLHSDGLECTGLHPSQRFKRLALQQDRPAQVEAIGLGVTVTAAAGLAGMLGAAPILVDAQVLPALSFIECGSNANRYATRKGTFALAPLDVVGDETEAPLVGNLIIVAGVLVLSAIVVGLVQVFIGDFPTTASMLRFPALQYIPLLAFAQGTASWSISLLIDDHVSPASLVGTFVSFTFPFVVAAVYLPHYRPFRPGDRTLVGDDPHRLMFMPYPKAVADSIDEKFASLPCAAALKKHSIFLPNARWTPHHLGKRYNTPGWMLMSNKLLFMVFPATQPLLVALITAPHAADNRSCALQYFALTIMFLVFAGLVAYHRPYRTFFWNMLQVLAHLTLCAISLVSMGMAMDVRVMWLQSFFAATIVFNTGLIITRVAYFFFIVLFEWRVLPSPKEEEVATLQWEPVWSAKKQQSRRSKAKVNVSKLDKEEEMFTMAHMSLDGSAYEPPETVMPLPKLDATRGVTIFEELIDDPVHSDPTMVNQEASTQRRMRARDGSHRRLARIDEPIEEIIASPRDREEVADIIGDREPLDMSVYGPVQVTLVFDDDEVGSDVEEQVEGALQRAVDSHEVNSDVGDLDDAPPADVSRTAPQSHGASAEPEELQLPSVAVESLPSLMPPPAAHRKAADVEEVEEEDEEEAAAIRAKKVKRSGLSRQSVDVEEDDTEHKRDGDSSDDDEESAMEMTWIESARQFNLIV